jgi:catalase
MTPAQKKALFDNTARQLRVASAAVQQRHVDNCSKADAEYGAGIARALGLL